MSDAVLALNAGSSSIKFALYERSDETPILLVKGHVDDSGDTRHFQASAADGSSLADENWGGGAQENDPLVGQLLGWIDAHLAGRRLAAVGHRIVHGGLEFREPVRLTADVVSALDRLTPLAPLHQPRSLAPVRAIVAVRPDLPQVGCFDTAFHHTIGPTAARYAIPRELEAAGVRRYGFHGLSYQRIADRLPVILPAQRKIVVAHLGSGSSLCAMKDGRSIDTTMGFSALDGLMMATRPGLLDPGIVLYLMKERGLSHDAIEDMLYHRSGLLGVSGLSGDLRVLSQSDDPHAEEAIDLFIFRISREVAAMANTLQGLDALVFTGGIGEHSAMVRRRVGERLRWMGVSIDAAANEAGHAIVSSPESEVSVRVEPANEELVIASATAAVLI